MKHLQKLFFSILALCALIQLSGCNKVFDKVFDDHKAKKCKITSFTQNIFPSGTRTLQFYYNHHGDIDSIIGDVATGSLGAHLFYFTYDNSHRLIRYVEDAGALYPPALEVHTYAYENGRIVRDSVRYPLNDNNTVVVRTLQYDSYGRIANQSQKILEENGDVIVDPNQLVFTYDPDGNLIHEGATYDDKVNFLLTNKYLIFTQRDYSRNNRLGATSYNNRGLPLGFAPGIHAIYGPSSLLSFGLPIQINYACDK